MRYEVLHGNINEVYRDLPVENEETPFRMRRFIGDTFGRIGFSFEENPKNSLAVYTPVIAGKPYLFQMFSSEQTGTKFPAGYFHAILTEASPEDFAREFSDKWDLRLANQDEMMAAAEGKIFHVQPDTDAQTMKISIKPEVMKEIFYACLNRWNMKRNAVTVLVPVGVPFQRYAKAVMREIYSFFPAVLRAASGFVSAPREGYEPEHGVSVIFLPDVEKNSVKNNALRIQESFGYFSSAFFPEIEPFVNYTLSLDEDSRKIWLEEVFQQVEGGGDAEIFNAVKPQDYASYYEARILWPELSDREVFAMFSQMLYEDVPPVTRHQMENLLLDRFPNGRINQWARREVKEMKNLNEILELARQINQIGSAFDSLSWRRETLLEVIARIFLEQCDGDEYNQCILFAQHKEPLIDCFGFEPVQTMLQRLQKRRDTLIEQQYQELVVEMHDAPEGMTLDECYPENRMRCGQRFVEITNLQFHRLIKRFPMSRVDDLFKALHEKLERCADMADEPAVQDMQACYDSYWNLWQTAQAEESRNLQSYFVLMAQIVQIPSPRLRPAFLAYLRQWLNEIDLVDYLDMYEKFCQDCPDIVKQHEEELNELIEEDFRILSSHPLHMKISSSLEMRTLFEQCSVYLARMESCHLQDVRAEVLLQFSSPRLIENYLLSVQELMAIIQFVLLNATAPLPDMPKEKLQDLILAFAAIGVFGPVHFDPLLQVSESPDYRRRLWKYCIEAQRHSDLDLLRIFEIYVRYMGETDTKRQLEKWKRLGDIDNGLYQRLARIMEENNGSMFRQRTTITNPAEPQKKNGKFGFDLKRTDSTEGWNEPVDARSFMMNMEQISQDIQEEQEWANANPVPQPPKWSVLSKMNLQMPGRRTSIPERKKAPIPVEKTVMQPKKPTAKRQHMLNGNTVKWALGILVAALLISQLIKFLKR